MHRDARPLGAPVEWSPVESPARRELRGQHVLLRPLSADDAERLYAISHQPAGDPDIWIYLPDGPYPGLDAYRVAVEWEASSPDPLYFAICPLPEAVPNGQASYLRITPEFGVIEIGHIWFGPALQRTTAATEAIYLLARHVFDDLGYRRLEWKCNALNAPSRRAAERFGFSFEGVFRNHMVVKGRNRDSAWFAITAEDWPAIRAGYRQWLAPGNREPDGRQKQRLETLIEQAPSVARSEGKRRSRT